MLICEVRYKVLMWQFSVWALLPRILAIVLTSQEGIASLLFIVDSLDMHNLGCARVYME